MSEQSALTGTDADFWSAFKRTIALCGDQAAIDFADRPSMSFSDLQQRSVRLAQAIEGLGVQPDDRVAVVAGNGPWIVELILAAAFSRFVLVPVNVRLTATEISFIINDAAPRLLFVDQARKEILHSFVDSETALLDVAGDLEMLIEATPDTASVHLRSADDDAAFLQLYTSGTTGHPKGAILSQRNISAIADVGADYLGPMHAGDVMMICLPMFHIAAIDLVVFALARGVRMVILPEVVPADVAAKIAAHKVNRILLVPAVIRMLVEHLEARAEKLESVETLIFGASPMPEELITRVANVMPSADLIHVYGLTETSGMVTYLPPEHLARGQRLRSCGRSFPTGEIAVVDADGRKLPPGTVGEVIYRGPQMMSGYWSNPAATASAIRDGWFHTGDAGYLDDEGYLYLSDRIKDMIKPGGENVYPAEVENTVLKHEGVADATVIGVPDDKWGEIVCAVVVPVGAEPPSLESIQTHVRRDLAGFKIPRRLEIVDALPRNGAGKVQKHVLRERYS